MSRNDDRTGIVKLERDPTVVTIGDARATTGLPYKLFAGQGEGRAITVKAGQRVKGAAT